MSVLLKLNDYFIFKVLLTETRAADLPIYMADKQKITTFAD